MKSLTLALTTVNFYPNRDPRLRLFALWYFTILIIVLTIVGGTVLGFEQSYAHPVIGVVVAVAVQMLLEWVDARTKGRQVRFAGSPMAFLNFLPSAIIPGLASALLLFANDRLWPVAFAAGASIASKTIFRAPVGNGQTQHIFNPSNFGITLTLLLMPSVGLAPPYQFTANVGGAWHWIVPAVVLLAGIVVHAKFTGRLPLVIAWLAGFVAQGLARSAIYDIPWVVPFVPMTSAAFMLFTLFMIPDPATTPIKPIRQVAFGSAVAVLYGILISSHIVFGLFIALASVCAVRGLSLHAAALNAWARRRSVQKSTATSFQAPSVDHEPANRIRPAVP